MLDFLFPLLIGTILGFLAGMGVGGGSLLFLWLTQVVELPQEQARITNLLFYLPAALAATLFRRKQQIAKTEATWGAAAGCCAALIFSLISRELDITTLKTLFGGLLILTGLREIFYRPRKAK